MDYKKKYEEALERARQVYTTNVDENKKSTEYIFPELKESEDERIRKSLIDMLKNDEKCYLKEIAWLEKQGEKHLPKTIAFGILNHLNNRLLARTGSILSKEECKSFENDFVNAEWKKVLDFIEKKGEPNTFSMPQTPIKDTIEVTSRMPHISDDMKPIAGFIMDYAHWDLHKDEWSQPTLTIPLFRVLDALIQRGNPYSECSKWQEKQREKPQGKSALEAIKEEMADNDIKVEPKFKVGQWIVWQDKCYKVNDNGCGYELVDQNGLSTSLEYGTIDKNAHIWDITKDAKDGDVLASKTTSCVLIFRGIDTSTNFRSYYDTIRHYDITRHSEYGWGNRNFLPATKEQRKLLFSKMKENGYRWDANNKQLIKLL